MFERKTPTAALSAFALAGAFALVGCDVDVDSGELDLPEYEVKKVDEGNFEMPEVDVELPDVTTETVEIEVPTLDIPEEGDTEAGESEAAQEVEEELGTVSP